MSVSTIDWGAFNRRLDAVLTEQRDRLSGVQQADGHWVFELEADSTIPSEYILLRHFLGTPDPAMERRIVPYLLNLQEEHGGWPLYHRGDLNISATVKAYYALKLAGEDIDSPPMRRAREALLAAGGAEKSNVFTRIALALFGQVPWRAVPVMPLQIMILPEWFPFHLSKIAYWSRTVLVPLLILQAHKPRAANPRGVDIQELFVTPPDQIREFNVNPTGAWVGDFFLGLDKVLRVVEPFFPFRKKSQDRALAFIDERLNGEDGLGAIFPAMANVVMAYHTLGWPEDHPNVVTAREAVDKLLTERDDGSLYCQPCLSPIWDTGLAAHAMMEAGLDPDDPRITKALDWLSERQILDTVGDWAVRRPNVRPGGWAFQYANDHYPDVDDTAMVVMALHRADPERYANEIDRAVEWVRGMQSSDGGWGAFEPENTHSYLNSIPFADHGALLDPPTADVTARCLGMLAQLGHGSEDPAVARAIEYLLKDQEEDGSWYGRWGANYVYGTWSVLCALNAAGLDLDRPEIRKAVAWLESRQREDGGWGEDCASYNKHRKHEVKESTASQTAWAVLALMAAGETESDAVRRGIEFLEQAPREGVRWQEDFYTGTGFPEVFYLRYHGYAAYFPLWAMGRYRRLMAKNDRRVEYGL